MPVQLPKVSLVLSWLLPLRWLRKRGLRAGKEVRASHRSLCSYRCLFILSLMATVLDSRYRTRITVTWRCSHFSYTYFYLKENQFPYILRIYVMQINFTQKFTVNTSSPKSTEMNGAIFILFFLTKKRFWGNVPASFTSKTVKKHVSKHGFWRRLSLSGCNFFLISF